MMAANPIAPLLAQTDVLLWILIGVAALIFIALIIVFAAFIGLWIQAYMAGARISFLQIVAMRLRKVNPGVVVRSKIMATQADIPVDARALEAHYLAGGNVINVIKARGGRTRSRILGPGRPFGSGRSTTIRSRSLWAIVTSSSPYRGCGLDGCDNESQWASIPSVEPCAATDSSTAKNTRLKTS